MSYKMGENILVRDGSCARWNERIFIKEGFKDGVICVLREDEEYYGEGDSFNTVKYNCHKPIPQKKYIPFTLNDKDMLRGKWVMRKGYSGEYEIIGLDCDHVRIPTHVENSIYAYRELLEDFLFVDGTSCGKIVED